MTSKAPTSFLGLAVVGVLVLLFMMLWCGDVPPPRETTVDFLEVFPERTISELTLIAFPDAPAGNHRSRKFLAWANTKCTFFCRADLNNQGDIISLMVDSCWHAKDEELMIIAKLPKLKSLTFVAEDVTNQGVRYLESISTLTRLTLRRRSETKITDAALQQLRRVNPNLDIELWP